MLLSCWRQSRKVVTIVFAAFENEKTINWKHHMVDSGSGQSPDKKNLQRIKNKVIFKRMHSMSARNSSLSRVRRGRKESSMTTDM